MSDADAAYADEVLAAAAPGLRPDQLARKAAALEMKLAPEAVRARKELARQLGQRVEARREESGNASLAGRELDTADVIASKAHIDAIAVKLRDCGLVEGTLDTLRALALVDLTQGRDPLDRIKPSQAPGSSSTGAAPGRRTGDGPRPARRPRRPRAAARPGQPPGPGRHPPRLGHRPRPRKRLGPAGRRRNQSPRPGRLSAPENTLVLYPHRSRRHRDRPRLRKGPAPLETTRPTRPAGTRKPGGIPAPEQATRLADFLRCFSITFEPVARDTCDHRHAEDRYVPGRKLRHLLRARSQTCTAPACNAQAQYCDIDHTLPYPDGPTCQCNTNPKCRRHHRTKQAPGWNATQPTPDTSTWTTPSGRTHTTHATTYDV